MVDTRQNYNHDFDNDYLVAALDALDVSFLTTHGIPETAPPLDEIDLLTGLASSQQARVRMAIIPLLLRHPRLAAVASAAADELAAPERLVLLCYYTAARLLQQKHRSRLDALWGPQHDLPDLFSEVLEIEPSGDPTADLAALARRQQQCSGQRLNWLGTYQHAAERLLSYGEKKRLWHGSTVT